MEGSTEANEKCVPPLPHVSEANNSKEDGIRAYLTKLNWPSGLQKVLLTGLDAVPSRFFVCDDSGTMMFSDGHKLITEGNVTKQVTCSRWSEMTESLRFHVDLASAAQAETEFRLLNGSNPITVGVSPECDGVSVANLLNQLDIYVGSNATKKSFPLSYDVNQVAERVTQLAPALIASGKKASLIILTDGQATDGDIIATFRRLRNLPVWVVIRLCTDDSKMVEYWNNIDSEVALNMDVLDDPMSEAKEIYRWLTYGEPLHRLREFGVTGKEMDLIDEATLTIEQMRNVCAFILDAPHLLKLTEWEAFSTAVSAANDKTPKVWNPCSMRMEKWIDMTKLTAAYNPGGAVGGECCIVA